MAMLKSLIGGKIDGLDPAVVVYLDDMMKEAMDDHTKREELSQALADFVPDWEIPADLNLLLNDLHQGIVHSPERDKTPTDGHSLESCSPDERGVTRQSSTRNTPSSSSQVSSNLKAHQHAATQKSGNEEAANSRQFPRKNGTASNICELIEEFLHSCEISDGVETVLLEYYESALLNFLKSAADRTGFPSPDDIEEIVDMFIGGAPNVRFLKPEQIITFLENSLVLYRRSIAKSEPVKKNNDSVNRAAPATAGSGNGSAQDCASRRAASQLVQNEQDWRGASGDIITLKEIFPGATRAELEAQLRGAPLEQVIEKMMETFELQKISASLNEERRAQAKAFEEEAKEAARRRALARYDKVEDYGKVEGGKRLDVSKVVHSKSAEIEEAIKSSYSESMPRERYINHQVVTHKGERFIIEKKLGKNAVPEDPSTFIGLKVKSKGKRGPSPAFK